MMVLSFHTQPKGARGNEIVALDPEQIKYIDNLNPTDSPDMRFKYNSTVRTGLEEIQQSSELLARHLRLTGDERLVFNEWQNEMQRKALGYYDPKTDKIDLNRLSEDTLNHELGHKLLERADNKQELLTAIRRFYGDNYLINKYGQQYGTTDINLLAEEQLADGFSEYYNGKLSGENTQRLAARLHIPQRIVAIYDRITEAIRGLIGKQDIIKQFYAQMETGKFRNTQQQVPGGDGRVRTMSLDSEVSERALRSFNSVKRGKQVKSIVGQLSKNGARKVAAVLQSTDFNQNARLVIDKNAVNHLRNSGHPMPYSPEGAVAADESGRQPSRPGRFSGDPDNGFNGSA